MESNSSKRLFAKAAVQLLAEQVPVTHPSATIAEVERSLLNETKKLETINYIYVLEADRRLIGVLSMKEVFRATKSKLVSELMKSDLIAAKPNMPARKVAMLALNHRLKEIPVVDGEGHFEGVVPYDAILKILHSEHIEEALRSAGIDRFTDEAETMIDASVFSLFKKRIPWLLVGLGGSAVAALVIGSFGKVLENQILLAAFIPAITYLSGAVGIQSETLFVRTAALDKNFRLKSYLMKDFATGIVISIVLALAMGILAFLIWQKIDLSLILTLSIFVGVQLSMLTAVILPWSFSKFRVDPAMVGGPLDTIISDIASVIVYFTFANLILQWLA